MASSVQWFFFLFFPPPLPYVERGYICEGRGGEEAIDCCCCGIDLRNVTSRGYVPKIINNTTMAVLQFERLSSIIREGEERRVEWSLDIDICEARVDRRSTPSLSPVLPTLPPPPLLCNEIDYAGSPWTESERFAAAICGLPPFPSAQCADW